MRRLRQPGIRNLVAVCPIFVDETIENPIEIGSMPGQYRFPLDTVADEAKEIEDLGIPAIILFGIPEAKDEEDQKGADRSNVGHSAAREVGTGAGAFQLECLAKEEAGGAADNKCENAHERHQGNSNLTELECPDGAARCDGAQNQQRNYLQHTPGPGQRFVLDEASCMNDALNSVPEEETGGDDAERNDHPAHGGETNEIRV